MIKVEFGSKSIKWMGEMGSKKGRGEGDIADQYSFKWQSFGNVKEGSSIKELESWGKSQFEEGVSILKHILHNLYLQKFWVLSLYGYWLDK